MLRLKSLRTTRQERLQEKDQARAGKDLSVPVRVYHQCYCLKVLDIEKVQTDENLRRQDRPFCHVSHNFLMIEFIQTSDDI